MDEERSMRAVKGSLGHSLNARYRESDDRSWTRAAGDHSAHPLEKITRKLGGTDLAAMYGVSTRDLNKAVSRNMDRFPDDFMLQLARSEFNDLKFQFGTSS